MKQYRVFIDITVTRTFSLKAESEEQAKEQALKQCRERSDYYARDNDGVVDVSVSDCEEDTEPEEERTTLDDGLDYVRGELDRADELLIYKATVSKNLDHRLPAATGLDDGKIIDLLEEYGEDNDLPEGWWEEYGDIDDILMKL
jgi:hypothetical protein